MRTIKFKAKTLNNSKWFVDGWIVGDLVNINGETCIKPKSESDTIFPTCKKVDPNTVCQFTGFKDIEGNEVWEGDILDGRIKGKVVFMFGTFALHPLDCNKREVFAPLYYFRLGDKTLDLKVIGNKFDK